MKQLVSEIQQQLSHTAERHAEHRFGDLGNYLWKMDWLRVAQIHVKRNSGSIPAGCDGMNMRYFEENLEGNLQALAKSLKTGTFMPSPVRRVYIPKSQGTWRALGIPSIRDRIVQEALRMLMEPIYEADFSPYSFGFRPNRCTMDAIKYLTWTTQEQKKFFWIIEGDISSYFDTINHRKLMRLLSRRIADKTLLRLIWQFLRAGGMEQKLFRDTKLGTPQGGIISPLVANIYLHELDRYMERTYTGFPQKEKTERRKSGLANYVYIRYADDFVVLCNGRRNQAEDLKQELKRYLKAELLLELSEEKTTITHLNDGCKFLGFWIQRQKGHHKMVTKVTIPDIAISRLKDKITCITDPATYVHSMNSEIVALNRVIGGWCRYYQYTGKASQTFNRLNHFVYWKMAHWIGRKYQLNMPEVLKRYGTNKTFVTDEYQLRMPGTYSTKQYKARFLKENPYTRQESIRREELSDDTYWTGREARPGTMDVRPLILQRDQFTGQICGEKFPIKQLQVDHIRPVKRYKQVETAQETDNLWILCVECHKTKTKVDQQGESRMR